MSNREHLIILLKTARQLIAKKKLPKELEEYKFTKDDPDNPNPKGNDRDGDGKKNEPKPFKAARKFKVGDKVKFKGARRVYKVVKVNNGRYDLEATTGGQKGSRPSNIQEFDLVSADASKEEVVDMQGRSAAKAATEEFQSGKVLVGLSRTIMESYGEVMTITKGGRIKVQIYGATPSPKGKFDQESYERSTKKEEVMQFMPTLHMGEWSWWNKQERRYIKGPYKGGKLKRLLD